MRYARYAWIIDTDHLYDGKFFTRSDVGTMGPSTIHPELEARLKKGEGEPFKMYDDDGELYYTGRVLGFIPADVDGFEPLHEFGMPNAGCTDIRYKDTKTGQFISL
jgi:hypothetical protein